MSHVVDQEIAGMLARSEEAGSCLVLPGDAPERLRRAMQRRVAAGEVVSPTRGLFARQELWDKCGEDTLRGLFLQELRRQYDAAPDDAVRRRIEQAARFGTAAMDDREV